MKDVDRENIDTSVGDGQGHIEGRVDAVGESTDDRWRQGESKEGRPVGRKVGRKEQGDGQRMVEDKKENNGRERRKERKERKKEKKENKQQTKERKKQWKRGSILANT